MSNHAFGAWLHVAINSNIIKYAETEEIIKRVGVSRSYPPFLLSWAPVINYSK